jgi:hypothetical protein
VSVRECLCACCVQHNVPSDEASDKAPWYSVTPCTLSVLGEHYRLLRCDHGRSDIVSLALVVPEFSALNGLGLPAKRTRYAMSLREFIAQS